MNLKVIPNTSTEEVSIAGEIDRSSPGEAGKYFQGTLLTHQSIIE